MDNTQETTADIIAEMRRWARNAKANGANYRLEDTCGALGGFIQAIADRIEAAHRREIDKLNAVIQAQRSQFDAEIDRLRREKAPGNMAKLREACKAALGMIFDLQVRNRSPIANSVYAVRRKISAALAEPPHEARWTTNGGYEFAGCSNCGHLQYAGWDSRAEQAEKIGDFHELYKFCPNCGAQMSYERGGAK